MSEALFDEYAREYKRGGETLYAFLDRSSRPEFTAARATLNAWFEHWPAEHRQGLKARIRSKDAAGFDGAFWELYLHEAHRRLGFQIEYEPKLAGKTTTPDFLMTKEDDSFYLEATVVGPPTSVVARRTRQQKVIDLIAAARHPDFGVRVRQIGLTSDEPPRRLVVAAVERWLETLNWETERNRINDHRREPKHIEVRGTHLFLLPFPRPPERRGSHDYPTVLSHPPEGGVVHEPPSILDDLRDKASKFGPLDRPYMIALLCLRDFTTENDVEQALYGPEAVEFSVTRDGPVGGSRWVRQPHGFWQHNDQQRATRVSGVLAAVHLRPWSVRTVAPRLWLNPWATRPVQPGLPWATVVGDLDANQLVRSPALVGPTELFAQD